jgi:SNF2 family DNA or RNA helicase
MMTILDGKLVTVTTVLAGLMKLQQCVSGFLIPSEGQDPIQISNSRIEALSALVDEIGDKVVIWCCFKYDVEAISEHLANKYGEDSLVTYYSETNVKERAEAVERINNDAATKFFIATNAASKGLTLTGASHALYYSRNYKLEDRLQSLDRIHRIGQSKTCVYHDLVTPGTVDERILQRLSEKEDLAASVIDQIKEMI